MRCSWRRIIRRFSTISATPAWNSAASTRRSRTMTRCSPSQPDHVGALVNRGNTLLRLNQPVEAIASYDAALAADARSSADPDQSRSCAVAGSTGRSRRWRISRRRSRPRREFAEAHFEAAMTQLTLGDFAAGWKAYEWRWKTGAFARHRRPFQAPLWLGDEPVCRQDHSAACRAGLWRHHPVHPLCAAAGRARRQCDLRGSAGAAAAAVATQPDITVDCVRRAASGIRPALSLAQSSAGVRDAACDDPGRRSISRGTRGAPGAIGASVCRRGGRAPDLSGPARRRTRTTPTGRSRSRGSPRLFENPPLQCFSLQSELRDADREVLARPAEPDPSRRRVSRFRRYRRRSSRCSMS